MSHADHMGHGDHMGHAGMDHASMGHDHGDHSGHDMATAVVNTTMKAVMAAMQPESAMDHSGHAAAETMQHAHAHAAHGTRDMDMDMDMDHGMSMSFHMGYSEVILFDWWSIDSVGGLIGSMIGIFILAMLYEGLKYWREHLFRKSIAAMQYCASVEKGSINEQPKPSQMNMLSMDHGIQTLLHVLQMIVSYFLMLIFMTYNGWLCIATVLGAGFGYFLFGWRKSVVVDITEHCH
ncbi:high affinity copper uptake protein 1-like isoform X2 [Eriocheir sinensis]|uniref:high affinity copper uptake protein 1-like isoform X2 n=1 Tax=Eriocheir sinensis TaxID=95602 RepID=UPI0021C68E16|nr:high affinity copper uptake protein 1-like isoform X2 [Eriocheir sinensis]XP_050686051.1 high affinity copper uptake protein 1-like isoform X2 [Eriocheir sinensis]